MPTPRPTTRLRPEVLLTALLLCLFAAIATVPVGELLISPLYFSAINDATFVCTNFSWTFF